MTDGEYRAYYTFDDIIGLDGVKAKARRLAELDCTVVLVGETGVGKELFAHAIHQASKRSGRFVPVNCAALPEHLFESELFGYSRGAFTDARCDKAGRLELAHQGTLFLDELADLPLRFQAKLLRIMEDGVVVRLGSVRPVQTDVRFVLASNESPAELMHNKILRPDFYYRIAGCELKIPPLRERPDEIPALVDRWLNQLGGGQSKRRFDRRALGALARYDYPGNVRELQRIIELACLNSCAQTMSIRDLPIPEQVVNGTRFVSLKAIKVQHAREVLSKVKDYDRAASILGISRRHLLRLIRSRLK